MIHVPGDRPESSVVVRPAAGDCLDSGSQWAGDEGMRPVVSGSELLASLQLKQKMVV